MTETISAIHMPLENTAETPIRSIGEVLLGRLREQTLASGAKVLVGSWGASRVVVTPAHHDGEDLFELVLQEPGDRVRERIKKRYGYQQNRAK